jgi:subtilisin family serine protease
MSKKIGSTILIPAIFLGLVFGNFVSANPFLFEFPENLINEYVGDEMVVRFKNDTRPFRVIKVPGGKVGEKIKEYLGRFDVEYAEPNYIARAFMTPNDTYYNPYQWNFDNVISGGVDAEQAWDISTGSGVVVAVVDTGIAYEDNGFWYRKAPVL